MSVTELSDSVLEAALHTAIAQRCERAYVHDLRNGLQSIYASVEVLTRMLAGKSAPTLPPEKVAEMARKAINAYEQSLSHTAKRLIAQNDTPLALHVDGALQELCAFLRNDATARGLTLQAATSGEAVIRSSPHKFRLSLLSVAVRMIDALRDGDIAVAASGADGLVSIKFTAHAAEVSDDALWRLSASQPSMEADWVLYATRKLVDREGGALAFQQDAKGQSAPAGPRIVILSYPATNPSS